MEKLRFSITRRSMFSAAILAPIAAAPAVAGSIERMTFAPSRVRHRKAWEAAEAALDRAEAAHVAACGMTDEADSLYRKIRPAMPMGTSLMIGDTDVTYNDRVRNERLALDASDKVARARAGYDEAYETQSAACSMAADAYEALMTTPAPDLVAVRRKVAEAMGRDDAMMLGFVLADLANLMEVGQ